MFARPQQRLFPLPTLTMPFFQGATGIVADHSTFNEVAGDQFNNQHTFNGPVDYGDTFHGPISDSIVGGRNNTNTINNKGPGDWATLNSQFVNLAARLGSSSTESANHKNAAQHRDTRSKADATRAEERKFAAEFAAGAESWAIKHSQYVEQEVQLTAKICEVRDKIEALRAKRRVEELAATLAAEEAELEALQSMVPSQVISPIIAAPSTTGMLSTPPTTETVSVAEVTITSPTAAATPEVAELEALQTTAPVMASQVISPTIAAPSAMGMPSMTTAAATPEVRKSRRKWFKSFKLFKRTRRSKQSALKNVPTDVSPS